MGKLSAQTVQDTARRYLTADSMSTLYLEPLASPTPAASANAAPSKKTAKPTSTPRRVETKK
jgi:hypothetical protein